MQAVMAQIVNEIANFGIHPYIIALIIILGIIHFIFKLGVSHNA